MKAHEIKVSLVLERNFTGMNTFSTGIPSTALAMEFKKLSHNELRADIPA